MKKISILELLGKKLDMKELGEEFKVTLEL